MNASWCIRRNSSREVNESRAFIRLSMSTVPKAIPISESWLRHLKCFCGVILCHGNIKRVIFVIRSESNPDCLEQVLVVAKPLIDHHMKIIQDGGLEISLANVSEELQSKLGIFDVLSEEQMVDMTAVRRLTDISSGTIEVECYMLTKYFRMVSSFSKA